MADAISVINYFIAVKREDGTYFASTGTSGGMDPERKGLLTKFTDDFLERLKKLNKELNKGGGKK